MRGCLLQAMRLFGFSKWVEVGENTGAGVSLQVAFSFSSKEEDIRNQHRYVSRNSPFPRPPHSSPTSQVMANPFLRMIDMTILNNPQELFFLKMSHCMRGIKKTTIFLQACFFHFRTLMVWFCKMRMINLRPRDWSRDWLCPPL